MTVRSQEHLLHMAADITSMLRLLTEAPDEQAFFATLLEALPQFLPMTRVDMLASEQREGEPMLLTCGDETDPPPSGARNATSLAEWLGTKGYATVFTLTLTGAGEQLGWLVLSRHSQPFEPET